MTFGPSWNVDSPLVALAHGTEDLKERLAYFEMRLAEATQKAAAKETYSVKFGVGFTTEN
jgi:hypothetical protein